MKTLIEKNFITAEEQRLIEIKKEIDSIRHSLTVIYIILFLDVIVKWLK